MEFPLAWSVFCGPCQGRWLFDSVSGGYRHRLIFGSPPGFIYIALVTSESERDLTFTLLNAALVLKTWDDSSLGEGRGHNIGALLVDKKGHPVAFARNESTSRRDRTEHAELRLIRGHIAAAPDRAELHKHTLYSSLEPCAMCAGMAAMTNIARVIYAQPNPVFGGVLDRLDGYPEPLISIASPNTTLATAFAASGHREVIDRLPNESARTAFVSLEEAFASFIPLHQENERHLADA